IRVPPLRERHEDIRVLAQHFLRVYAAKNGRELEGFTGEAIERLEAYAWPGNVRELENLIERSVVLARKDRIEAEDLPDEIVGVKRPPRDAILELIGTPLGEIEQRLLDETLRITGGNKTQAAKLLGIDPRTVSRKLERRRAPLRPGARDALDRARDGARSRGRRRRPRPHLVRRHGGALDPDALPDPAHRDAPQHGAAPPVEGRPARHGLSPVELDREDGGRGRRPGDRGLPADAGGHPRPLQRGPGEGGRHP